MFSKSRINEPGPKQAGEAEAKPSVTDTPKPAPGAAIPSATPSNKPKPPASMLSAVRIGCGTMSSVRKRHMLAVEVGSPSGSTASAPSRLARASRVRAFIAPV